jgi:cytochrome c551/c552
MAGPVYYSDMFPQETRLPAYYDGKLFFYEWIRGFIKVVTMKPNGDYEKMEPFMEHTKFNSLMDMELGPDGKLYLLEYGSGWFSKNPDAALSRVDFNGGNRAPAVAQVVVDKSSGVLPMEVNVTAEASDPERDPLTYTWDFGNGNTVQTTVPEAKGTHTEIGDYTITVEVSDPSKLTAKSNPISVYAGNAAPNVTINTSGNKMFYFPGKKVSYEVDVRDPDDASEPDMSSLFVSADYVEGSDLAETVGHQVVTETMIGKNMVTSLDCKACHSEQEKSIGPAYIEVAKRYKGDRTALNTLASKLISGGSGVWGETVMPAHADMKESDAKTIISWVLSLADDGKTAKTLPARGSLQPTLDKKLSDNGVLIVTASYTDKGGAGVKPLTTTTSMLLRNSQLDIARAQQLVGYSSMQFGGRNLLIMPADPGSFSVGKVDLTGVGGVDVAVGSQEPLISGYAVEVRLDGVGGRVIGEGIIKPMPGAPGGFNAAGCSVSLQPVTDGELHELYIVTTPLEGESKVGAVSTIVLKSK